MSLGISSEVFDEVYKGSAIYDNKELFFTEPKSKGELELRLRSKLWRCNNLYFIIPKVVTAESPKMLFKMNYAQHLMYKSLIDWNRLIILKSRQVGYSTNSIIINFDDCLTIPNFLYGFHSQGEVESRGLMRKVKFLWDNLDPLYKAYFGLTEITNNSSEFKISNGSELRIASSFRGSTLQSAHISEMAKICASSKLKEEEVISGTLQAVHNSGRVIIESTAEGDTEFKNMFYKALTTPENRKAQGDYKTLFVPWFIDPDSYLQKAPLGYELSKEEIEYFEALEISSNVKLTFNQKVYWSVKNGQLKNGQIYQEYPSSPEEAFKKVLDGSYYSAVYHDSILHNKRLVENLYESSLPLYCSVDLGLDDYTVFLFYQVVNNEFRFIDELVGNEIYLADWIKILKNRKIQPDRIFLPHDAKARGMDGRTREDLFFEGGYTDVFVLKRENLANGIESVREALTRTWIDNTNCSYLQQCLVNYTKKWDKTLGKWADREADTDYNHGADALRYAVQSSEYLMERSTLNTNEYSDFAFTSWDEDYGYDV